MIRIRRDTYPSLRVRLGLIAGLLLSAAPLGAAAATPSAAPTPTPPPPPSAIGNESITSLAVSPAYMRTGTVLASGSPGAGCGQGATQCSHLWATHDRGVTWKLLGATGWSGGPPIIGVDGQGHEIVYATASKGGLQVSRDGGSTWTTVGGTGTATPTPTFGKDGAVAVAAGGGNGHDYILRGTATNPVTGSGGALADLSFTYPAGWPSTGIHAPVLLSAGDRSSGLPVIQQCDMQLSCHGATSLPGASVYSVPVSLYTSDAYASDGVVFAQSGRGIYKSTDGGLSFAPLSIGQSNATVTATPSLALAPGYRDSGPVRTLYASVLQLYTDPKNPRGSRSEGGVYRSTDAGVTWSPIGSPGPFDYGSAAVAAAPDGKVFASYLGNGHAGLLCSTDAQTWNTCGGTSAPKGSTLAQPAGSPSSCGGRACAGQAPVTANGDTTATSDPSQGAGLGTTTPTGASGQITGSGNRPRLLIALGTGLVALVLGAAAYLRRRTASRREST